METDIKKIIEKEIAIRLIYNPKVLQNSEPITKIVKILSSSKHTRIDIVTAPNTIKYNRNWWVNIHKEIYIRPISTNIKLSLLEVINLPLAPKKHYFKSSNELIAFTLVFPALPKDVRMFDIIESNLPDTKTSSWLNFYGVSLESQYAYQNTSLYAFEIN